MSFRSPFSTAFNGHSTKGSPDGFCACTNNTQSFTCWFCCKSLRVRRSRCGNVIFHRHDDWVRIVLRSTRTLFKFSKHRNGYFLFFQNSILLAEFYQECPMRLCLPTLPFGPESLGHAANDSTRPTVWEGGRRSSALGTEEVAVCTSDVGCVLMIGDADCPSSKR